MERNKKELLTFSFLAIDLLRLSYSFLFFSIPSYSFVFISIDFLIPSYSFLLTFLFLPIPF